MGFTNRYSSRPFSRGYSRPYMSRGTGVKPKVNSDLQVYHNAFSTATTNAKIPDGRCYNSAGIRLQAVKEFTNDDTGTMNFLFFPGINNGVLARSVVETGPDGIMPYTSHAPFSDATGTQTPGDEIARWRVVSQAHRVSLVNNSDENDGWWEAIRAQVSPLSTRWQLELVDGSYYIGGAAGDMPGIDSSLNMVEHPTYATGKLRDIHRHVFDLMPQGNAHDFNDLRDNNNSEELMLDLKNYDCILLRVHGRSGASTPTRVVVHSVCNQEVLYNEASSLSRYHSEATNNSAIFEASKRRRQNGIHKAAKRQRTAIISME